MRIVIDNKGVVESHPEETTTVTISGSLTTIGSGTMTYAGGTIVPPTQKFVSFTGSNVESTVYEIRLQGLTGTLSSLDQAGTRYEFYDNTGTANPNFLIIPNGGKFISSSLAIGSSTGVTLTVQGFHRVVSKMSDGNWLMGGI